MTPADRSNNETLHSSDWESDGAQFVPGNALVISRRVFGSHNVHVREARMAKRVIDSILDLLTMLSGTNAGMQQGTCRTKARS